MKNLFSKTTYVYFLISAIFFVAFLGVYIFAGFFVKNLLKSTAENLSQLAALNRKDQNVQTLRRSLKNTEENRALLNTYFVSEDNIVGFLEKIEEMGPISGTTVTLQNVNQEGNPKNLVLLVKASGPFSNIMTLTKLFEQAPYGIVVDKLYLNKIINPTEAVATGATGKDIKKEIREIQWEADITIRLISFAL